MNKPTPKRRYANLHSEFYNPAPRLTPVLAVSEEQLHANMKVVSEKLGILDEAVTRLICAKHGFEDVEAVRALCDDMAALLGYRAIMVTVAHFEQVQAEDWSWADALQLLRSVGTFLIAEEYQDALTALVAAHAMFGGGSDNE